MLNTQASIYYYQLILLKYSGWGGRIEGKYRNGGGGWGGSEIVSKHIQEVYTNTKYSFHKLTHININSQTDSSQNKQTVR